MVSSVIEENEYSLLNDLRLETDCEGDGTFSLSFWLYLEGCTQFPATIIRQVHSNIENSVPFLLFDENKKMMLMQLPFLHKESSDPSNCTPWNQVPYAAADIEFPLERWVHIGCEVCTNFARLYINGDIVGENALSSSLTNHSNSNGLKKLTLVGTKANNHELKGYIHGAKLSPQISSMKELYDKNPPLYLSVDVSSASDIEEDIEGVWSIVGGKASCRNFFSLNVVLSNALGQPVNKEIEVIAALLYGDNGTPVEKPDGEEAPLLTSYAGIEYASCDRPSKLLQGSASFRLKISQLSSKCDNRLFRIRFDVPNVGNYPFLSAFSLPIRCISRKTAHQLNGSQPATLDNGVSEALSLTEAEHTSASKRIKSGPEQSAEIFNTDVAMGESDETNVSPAKTNFSPARSDTQAQTAAVKSLERKPALSVCSVSDSESTDVRDSKLKSMSSGNPISDVTVFKYCLGGIDERALILKELAVTVSEQELADFAQQVSLYSGCVHHGHQITIAKKLIEDGTKAWDVISQSNDRVRWENIVYYIAEQFMKIACCNSRSLSLQDLEILRRVAGCQEYVTRENFEKLWCWMYPVAITCSREKINATWSCTSPKWIEGLVTMEEAEFSLRGPRGLQEPGTFILRFPTSRSWPHPDAGSIVITYVGGNFALRHRLLSLDYLSSVAQRDPRPLQDMLLAEPELSRLGSITRSN